MMIGRRAAVGGLAAVGIMSRARAAAAPAPFNPYAAYNKEGRYLPVWSALTDPAATQFADATEQWAAVLGDEAIALAHAAPDDNGGAPDLTGATPEDAVDAIVRASRGRRVVMLNEAHVASRHRMFLADVLRALRPEGFTHFAAETLLNSRLAGAPQVSDLRAGDPLRPAHGFYIADPAFAEAVREALQLGYRLTPYEERQDQEDPALDPLKLGRRENWQAMNLAEAMAKAPEARFVVHVGYGHIETEHNFPNGRAFAGILWRRTGVRPLTVVQANSGSFGPHARDSAGTAAMLRHFQPRRPIVIRSRSGEIMGVGPGQDLAVLHPSLPDVEGRPGWLAAAHGRRRAEVRLPEAKPPALAQAIHAADPEPAIPADQYRLPPGAREAVFHLRPGRYRIRLETLDGFTPVREIAV